METTDRRAGIKGWRLVLLELHIKNFALIDSAILEFHSGFTVLTGETGAGKSIIIDAVDAVLGARLQASEVVRAGASCALVEGAFTVTPAVAALLADMGMESADEVLVLSREIQDNGRNRCRVNGQLANVSTLQKIGALLVDIHGQHEHQSLFSAHTHLDILDAFGGLSQLALRTEVSELVKQRHVLRREMQVGESKERERLRRLDILAFQIEEIAAAQLSANEDEALEEERLLLAHAGKLQEELATAYAALYEGGEGESAYDQMGKAIANLGIASRYDTHCRVMHEALEALATQLAELGRDLRLRRDEVRSDPQRLTQVEERLVVLERLKGKYGGSISEILQYKVDAAVEHEQLQHDVQHGAALAAEVSQVETELRRIGLQLHQMREATARQLDAQVTSHLQELGMQSAVFHTQLELAVAAEGLAMPSGEHLALTERGLNNCEFLFSANPGEAAKPLVRIASGGEISRVMLAIKATLAKADPLPTLIFDEIDAGLGGRAASAVARKLAQLAQSHQVLCVTHIAQVAGAANSQILIEKVVSGGRAQVLLRELNTDERVNELARMLDGTYSDTTLEHARELLASAQKGAS